MPDERQAALDRERELEKSKTLEERLSAAEERAKKDESSNDRLLTQSKEWKDKAQKASADDDERIKAAAAEKEKEAEARGEYKKLLEQQKLETEAQRKRADDSDARAKETDNTLLEARKLAFENRLGGRLKNDKYLGFVNTKDILIDPDTGDIDTSSVDSSVKSFLGEHKELVNFSAGKLPNFQGGKGEHITNKQWSGMSHKDRLDNLSKVVDNDTKNRKKN